MAPRRGGGGGGYSGGSSISDTPWGQYLTLHGSHFTEPRPVASIVFLAIGCLGLVGIIFFALTIKNKTLDERNRKLFRGYAFWLTILLLLVHYIFDLIVNCLYEAEASVQQVFLLIRILINQTRYLAEISLLGVLFLLLPYCTKCPRHDSRHKSLALGLKFFHYGLIFILSTLWVAALPFKIKYTVKFVEYYSYRSYKSDLQNWYKIDTAYSIIVVFGSLLVLSWAITGLLQRSSGSHGRVELLFFTCVAVPFFIRSVYEMAITIRLQLLDKNNSENLLLATNIIYTSTSLAIYTGIVLLGYLFSKDMIHPAGNNVGAFVGPLNPYGLATHNSYYYQGNPPYPGLNSGPKNQMQVHEANMAVPSAYLAQGGQNWPMQSPGHPIYAPLQQQGGYQYPQPGMQQQHYPPAQSYSPVSPINPHEVAGSGVPESRSPPPSGAQANIQPPK